MSENSGDRSLEELVAYDLDARGVATITIDRPETKNALTYLMRDRVSDLLEAASADVNVRVVVVSGSGGAFCAGADLRMPQPPNPRPDDAPKFVAGEVAMLLERGWQRLARAVLECTKPVIAAVDGVAAGGGAQLALACDLVLVSERATFVEVFVNRGIVPDAGAAYIVTRLVGPQKAKELFFFGDSVTADEAYRIGLANRVAAVADLPTLVDEWAGRLATQPTRAIGQTKLLVNRALQSDLDTALRDEAVAQELVQQTYDAREGVQAFVERRDPEFKGW